MESVRRSTAEHRRTEVLHKHNLLFGVAGRSRQLHSTEEARCIVSTESASEQSVAIAHLHDVAFAHSIGSHNTCGTLSPHGNVVLGVSANDRLTCGS